MTWRIMPAFNKTKHWYAGTGDRYLHQPRVHIQRSGINEWGLGKGPTGIVVKSACGDGGLLGGDRPRKWERGKPSEHAEGDGVGEAETEPHLKTFAPQRRFHS